MTNPTDTFHRMGAFPVGNRLLPPDVTATQAHEDRNNSLTSGHRACRGCGEALAARWAIDAALRAAGGQIVVANATGCLEVFSTPYPESAWRIPWIHSVFGNTPAVATGIAAAMKVKGKTGIRVIAQGGDGGTTDIGLGCLSGMFERNDDVLYICYDNEAYMNTGVQRSSATPPMARTATTPTLGSSRGSSPDIGKSVPLIAIAHQIPFVTTASVAHLADLENKISRAVAIRGARYVHIHSPCPLGWGTESSQTILVARLAVQSGLFPLFEANSGEIAATTTIGPRVPVEDYLKIQKRFRHLFHPQRNDEALAAYQAIADNNIRRFGL